MPIVGSDGDRGPEAQHSAVEHHIAGRNRSRPGAIASRPMAISDEKYVLLTTFRKTGDAVATPVWIAPLPNGGAGFTTELDAGKVKRIRHTPRVTLQACSATGKVKPGSEVVEAKAEVMQGADARPIEKAIRRKYPAMVSLLSVPSFFVRLVRRKPAADECAIHLTFG